MTKKECCIPFYLLITFSPYNYSPSMTNTLATVTKYRTLSQTFTAPPKDFSDTNVRLKMAYNFLFMGLIVVHNFKTRESRTKSQPSHAQNQMNATAPNTGANKLKE